MNVARRDVDTVNKLSLILPEGLLIKLVWGLEPIAREKQIQVKRIFGVWAVIDAIENASRRALVVQDGKLRRIKEPARSLEVKRDEVAELRISIRQRSILANCAECTVRCTEAARRLLLI